MAPWHGPGSPFCVLFDEDSTTEGRGLPSEVQEIYGEWRLPEREGRPYIYANFVMSHDGRISFCLPGAAGGGAVSGNNAHDQWLMGLLRARADAVLVGDNTLRLEPEHCWTAEAIFPGEAEAFHALRVAEGRTATPLHVFASYNGNIHAEAAIFGLPAICTVIATTSAGVRQARSLLGHSPNVEYLALGEEAVDLSALMRVLYERYQVRSLLCEGGPTLYGSLLATGVLDEEFLTHSPLVVGNDRRDTVRPGLVEGVAFTPDRAPWARTESVRRAGDYLFLRSRYAMR